MVARNGKEEKQGRKRRNAKPTVMVRNEKHAKTTFTQLSLSHKLEDVLALQTYRVGGGERGSGAAEVMRLACQDAKGSSHASVTSQREGEIYP